MSKTFDEVKEVVMANQFSTKKLEVRDIKYLKEDLILIKNTPIKTNKVMTKSLLTALGVRTDVLNNLGKIAPEMTEHYILKARANRKLKDINVIFDKNNKIARFGSNDNEIMPGDVFMGIVERMMNTSNNLSIEGITANQNGVTLNILDHKSEIDLFRNGAEGKGKEIFKFGTSLTTGLDKPLSFDQFASRLWCTNGCSTQIENKTFNVGEITPEAIWNFMTKFDNFQQGGYGRIFFESHMDTAVNTRASLGETLSVYNSIEGKLGLEIAAELLPVGHLYRDYARSGVDITKLSAKQLSTGVTNYSVWQIFNALTDAASNFGPADIAMQMKAGQLLTSSKDMANVITINPYGKV